MAIRDPNVIVFVIIHGNRLHDNGTLIKFDSERKLYIAYHTTLTLSVHTFLVTSSPAVRHFFARRSLQLNSHAALFDDIFRSIEGIELRFSGVVANIFLKQKKQTLHGFIASGSFQHFRLPSHRVFPQVKVKTIVLRKRSLKHSICSFK